MKHFLISNLAFNLIVLNGQLTENNCKFLSKELIVTTLKT